ncbi:MULTISPECIES: HAMP domain-containing sensor histidine kinase [Arthrobacter]|uniref:histidine kinase n=2 Tax=Arthrobacter TaxID=1663 RepID=A0ABU9KP00_9MICC|nr:HAMP domain-containing sensor histidine kinase [Arthrobacter sp. YJM1]MDP5228670.1 HAMP domain-containing sensor histidine kinase [Arthrobacter sp. YJM1]
MRDEVPQGPDYRVYRRSVARIGYQVAVVCAALVFLGGALAIAYVFWQSRPAKLSEPHKSEDIRIFLDPVDLTVAGLLVGTAAVICAGLAAWVIARRAVRPLNEAFHMQRRFVADASHELRTPLAVMNARAQQLAALLPRDDPRRAVADALREDTRIMTGIVDDMLETATAGADSATTAPSSYATPFAEVQHGVLDDLRLLADERGVSVRGTDLNAVLAVPAPALRRCLLALVDNAIDHSPEGGTVSVDAGLRGAMVSIRVTDEGGGITGIEPARVFDRFAHGAAPTTPHGESRTRHGIGLALVRELAGRHGGTVQVKRTGPDGTVFELVLPLAGDGFNSGEDA